jgi:2-oxoisovalerate dehydrogenase E1 component alpha subunit
VNQALGIARNGGGPTVIEAVTYRLSDHTTADDARRYRGEDEVKNAWKVEPLLRLRKYLIDNGHWSDAQEEELKNECSQQVEAAVAEYMNTPKQTSDAMFDYLFANPPKHLLEQREQARHYAGKSGHGSH